jgi:hypothetical protein
MTLPNQTQCNSTFVNGKTHFDGCIPEKDLFDSLLYPCGEVWEFIEYFADSEGKRPFYFSRNTEPSEPGELSEPFDLSELPEPSEPGEPACEKDGSGSSRSLTDEEREEERTRYIRRQKKEIRRLINRNELFYMFTLTFALRMHENVQGLRFTDMMDSEKQRDRELVLNAWNRRLTVIRKTLKEAGQELKFVMVLERHEGEKTSEEKFGTYHVHLATNISIDKHVLQRLWGYGVVWIDDFRSVKTYKDGKYVNEGEKTGDGSGMRENPGQYMSKYLDKEVGNPDFLCKHAYSSSRNLARPEHEKRRDRKEQQHLFEHPLEELDRQGIHLEEDQRERIQSLKGVHEVQVFDSLQKEGKLCEVEIPLETPVTLYLRMRVYNFRVLRKGGRQSRE